MSEQIVYSKNYASSSLKQKIESEIYNTYQTMSPCHCHESTFCCSSNKICNNPFSDFLNSKAIALYEGAMPDEANDKLLTSSNTKTIIETCPGIPIHTFKRANTNISDFQLC
jgi:hypothetical protein